jgi:hypothetical protein
MTPADCEFEADVLAAAMEGRWPEGAHAELRQHASACALCSEAAQVACSIGNAREEMRISTIVPDGGRVWWLAQIRARREAIAAAGRPITLVQMIAFACATGLLGACFGATSGWFQSALRRIASSSLAPLLAEHSAWAIGMAAAFLAASAAACFAIAKPKP